MKDSQIPEFGPRLLSRFMIVWTAANFWYSLHMEQWWAVPLTVLNALLMAYWWLQRDEGELNQIYEPFDDDPEREAIPEDQGIASPYKELASVSHLRNRG